MSILTSMIQRLPYEPRSMWRAKEQLGGPEWYGWSRESAGLADLVDLMDLNTRATAQQRAKYQPLAPRPEGKKQTVVKAKSVASMNWDSALSIAFGG